MARLGEGEVKRRGRWFRVAQLGGSPTVASGGGGARTRFTSACRGEVRGGWGIMWGGVAGSEVAAVGDGGEGARVVEAGIHREGRRRRERARG